MASAADLQSLFAGVLTPIQLKQQEIAQQNQRVGMYAQDSDRPWRALLEQSLNGIGAALPNSPQNQLKDQAASNEAVLKKATQGYSEKVKAGMTSDDAQLATLGDAIDEFSAQGNWEAISSLAPQYLALQSKQAEIGKLKQETATSAQTAATSAVNAQTKVAETVDKLKTGETTRAKNSAQTAQAYATTAKTRQDTAKTEGINIVDLTQPKAGPVVASIDPVTREATVFDPETGAQRTLKPGQYRDVSKQTSGGTSGKPMTNGVAKDIRTAGSELDQTEHLIGTFQPSFGGYKVKEAGDADLALKRNIFGDKTGAAEWWSSYQTKVQTIRHGLYGASFTKNEQAEWNKQAVNPGMRPEVIQRRLAAQQAIEDRVARRLYKGWSFDYNPQQVEAFLGRSYADSPDEAPTSTPTAGAGDGWSVVKVK